MCKLILTIVNQKSLCEKLFNKKNEKLNNYSNFDYQNSSKKCLLLLLFYDNQLITKRIQTLNNVLK